MHDLIINKSVNKGLSNDINIITREILTYKNEISKSIFEIGKRLKHVKEEDLLHGQFGEWVTETLGFHPTTASRFIAVYEQFGNLATSLNLDVSKFYEMVNLPPKIDRQQFMEQEHVIPSTGESKTVDQMTVKELREVKNSIKKAEREKQPEEKAQYDSAESNVHKQDQCTTGHQNEEKNNALSGVAQDKSGQEDADTSLDSPEVINNAIISFTEEAKDFIAKYHFLLKISHELFPGALNEDSKDNLNHTIESLQTFVSNVMDLATKHYYTEKWFPFKKGGPE